MEARGWLKNLSAPYSGLDPSLQSLLPNPVLLVSDYYVQEGGLAQS